MAAISICLPVFNAARYLREALDGILGQTFGDWQLLVSDNASTDDTREIIANYRDPRIDYFRHESNIGAGPNWQSVLRRVTAPLFCFHAGDDYLLPEHFSRRVAALHAHPESAFAHGAVRLIDAEGRHLRDYVEPLDEYAPREIAAPLFLQRNIVNVAGAVIHTEAMRPLGFALDLRYSLLFDWHLFMTLTLHSAGIPYDPVPTAAYRFHSDSVARRTEASGRWLVEEKRLQLDSLREERARWSTFLDPDAAAREITRPLLRRAVRRTLRGDFATAAALWRLTRGARS